MTYEEYATKVAEILGLHSLERLEDCYGDMIRDCYSLADSVEKCVRYCRHDDKEYMGTAESRFSK